MANVGIADTARHKKITTMQLTSAGVMLSASVVRAVDEAAHRRRYSDSAMKKKMITDGAADHVSPQLAWCSFFLNATLSPDAVLSMCAVHTLHLRQHGQV